VVGDRVTMTNGALIAGHVRLGDDVIMGGLSAIQQRTRVGRGAFIGGMSGVGVDVIPFGLVSGNHAALYGLNIVGLKRRGFSRETIHRLRAAQKFIFEGDGVFMDRVNEAAQTYADCPEAMEIVAFIRAEPTRPLAQPHGQV
jgi:UDP-N-acetylglucosamine acyltransferase